MMNLNNSKKKSCFPAIFVPSHPCENYPDKKTDIKKPF